MSAKKDPRARLASVLRGWWDSEHGRHPEPFDEDTEREFWLGMADLAMTAVPFRHRYTLDVRGDGTISVT